MTFYQRYGKRSVDVILSLTLIVVTSWLFLVIILLYLISLQFPVFFSQNRIGKDERIFTLFKFRTLKPGNGELQNRTFWLGRFLRASSLDELPQLLHVVRGEMSLIGPRPLPDYYLQRFSDRERKRHLVRPGMSGWAQVNGRHNIAWDKKFELDLYYVGHVSLKLDALIFIKTIYILLLFRKDNSLHEQPFKGTSN